MAICYRVEHFKGDVIMEKLKYYIIKNYGNYITKTRITKNGLFIYGGNYKSSYGKHTLYTFISSYDKDNKEYIDSMLKTFINDVKRLIK